MTDPRTILKQTFGFDQFRGVQEEVIGRVLAGRQSSLTAGRPSASG